jgi:hypothetical protein
LSDFRGLKPVLEFRGYLMERVTFEGGNLYFSLSVFAGNIGDVLIPA